MTIVSESKNTIVLDVDENEVIDTEQVFGASGQPFLGLGIPVSVSAGEVETSRNGTDDWQAVDLDGAVLVPMLSRYLRVTGDAAEIEIAFL